MTNCKTAKFINLKISTTNIDAKQGERRPNRLKLRMFKGLNNNGTSEKILSH